MARKKKDDKTPPLSNPIPLRFPQTTLSQADAAGKHLPGSSQQDILRLASEIGLAALAMVDYDVPGIVAKFALEKAGEQSATPNAGMVRAPQPTPSSKSKREASG